jgi:hypothetical protein
MILLATLLLLKFNALAFEDEQAETIRGTVVKTHGQNNGEAVVAIQVAKEAKGEKNRAEKVSEDFIVGNTDKGHELTKLVGKRVEATGVIKADEDGSKTILVTEFTLIDAKKDAGTGDEERPQKP